MTAMSELPQIDPVRVAHKLITKNGELTYQVTQLEVLAEALRDERDERDVKIAKLEQQLSAAEQSPVVSITSPPAQ